MRQRKKVLSILLSCAMVFSAVQPMGVLGADTAFADGSVQEARDSKNLALGAAMTASGSEAATFSADKANDGSLTTRWASAADGSGNPIGDSHWLAMDLGSVKSLSSVAIQWERKNATSYSIQHSEDGKEWKDITTRNAAPSAFRDTINFDKAIETQYLRVLIKAFNSTADKEDGQSVTWGTVSIFEFEAYGESLEPPVDPSSMTPVYNKNTNKVEVQAPAGYTVVSNGADFEQIVADDFTVRQPLTDKDVRLALKVTDPDGNTTVSKEHTLRIPGLYPASTGNEKPSVIPEIAEWHSDSKETFLLKASAKIVIDSEELRYAGTEFQKDLADITGITLPVTVGSPASANAGDFCFTLSSEDTLLGEEGYAMDIADTVRTEAVDAKGVYWATRTILQTIKLAGDGLSMPKGQMRDYPKYPVRGFVFDVGRKAVSLDTLKDMAKNMSWYKMNDFQVHLSDNYIFLEDYHNSADPDPLDGYAAYSGYRLESEIKNDAGKSIASDDYHYSKAEFKSFIEECRLFGVDIVPEIDVPAHAMAITEVFPEFAVNGFNPRVTKRSIVDHLDIARPEVVDFTKTIFDDYIEDGTFDADTIIHIGADEFESSPTAYREFLNTMLPYIKETNTVRLWGGLTWIKDNKTEITPEAIDGAQINLWSRDWADGVEMYNMGFDLINTLDSFGYMVPDGSGSTGAYADYLNKTSVFNSFSPNNVARSGGFTALPSGDKQVLGGAFAIWQDNIDKRSSGLSEEDLFIRFFDALALYAEKTWANGQEKGSVAAIDTLVRTISTAPNTNPYTGEASDDGLYAEYTFDNGLVKDNSLLDRTLTNLTNVSAVSAGGNTALKLTGGSSYAQTPLHTLGSTEKKTLSFTMNLDEVTPGQILFEADADYGTHDIRITENNKLGFTRELFEYEFDYVLTPNTALDISITTGKQQTSLYVNGEFAASATGKFVHKDMVKKSGITNASFALPLQRIGSKKNAIKGTLDNIRINGSTGAVNTIPSDDFIITCDNENVLTTDGNEGPAYLAFDGNPSTIWHSNYTPKKELPATITVDLGAEYEINKMIYLPRQNKGSDNGIVTNYSLSVSTDGTNYKKVSSGNLTADTSEKIIRFDPVKARYVQFTALEGKQGFASAAEITFYTATNKADLQNLYDSFKAIVNNNYTEASWKAFQSALASAEKILEKDEVSQEKVDEAIAALQNAKNELKTLPTPPVENTVDKKALQSLYNSCAALQGSSYTADSWKSFASALAAAKAVLNSETVDQAAVNQALAALQNAKNGLKKPAVPEKPVVPALPKKGSVHLYKNLRYKVTASTTKTKTVTVTGANKKTYSKITIPASVKIKGYTYRVTEIGNKAFYKNTRLKTAVIGANITKIGKESFNGCRNLKNITIHSTKIKAIKKYAFKSIFAKAKIKVPKNKLRTYKTYLKKSGLSATVKIMSK